MYVFNFDFWTRIWRKINTTTRNNILFFFVIIFSWVDGKEKINTKMWSVCVCRLVINAISGLDSGRRCYRLVGGVLVERTVGEVLPAVRKNLEGVRLAGSGLWRCLSCSDLLTMILFSRLIRFSRLSEKAWRRKIRHSPSSRCKIRFESWARMRMKHLHLSPLNLLRPVQAY